METPEKRGSSMQSLSIQDETEDYSKSKLSPLKFVFVIYFCVCGGAYGVEEAIMTGWPAFTLTFILVVPLLWNIPIALVTAELGSALPTNEGVFVWINEAFGQRFSFVTAIVYWINYTVDTALYPVLFAQYFKRIDTTLFSDDWYFLYGIPIALIFFITTMNLLGVDVIGGLSTVLVVIQSLPILIMFFWSLFTGRIHPYQWAQLRPEDSVTDMIDNVGDCFQVIIWSYSGYDAIGSIVEELEDSNKNLTRTLLAANFLSAMTYLIGVVGGLGIQPDYTQWTTGAFCDMGFILGGKWLKYSIIISGCLATAGTANALMFPTSQQLWALGGEDYLDVTHLQYKHPRYNTPWVAIFINGLICTVCVFVDFLTLVQVNNVLYSVLVILVCLSAVKLRYSENGKNLIRPFKIAESNEMVVLSIIWPILICIYLIVSATIDDWRITIACVGYLVAIIIIYFLCDFRKRNGYLQQLSTKEDGRLTQGLLN